MYEGESTTMIDDGTISLIDEIETTVKEAAAGQRVVLIRLAVGKELSVSKVEIAKELHRRFPDASIEMKESALTDSVTVRDIEVE
jgi:hypothetical protein